jgi:hypothetical protein
MYLLLLGGLKVKVMFIGLLANPLHSHWEIIPTLWYEDNI